MKRKVLSAVVGFALLCGGCGGGAPVEETKASAVAAPDTFESKGRVYVRRDLWSSADIERIEYEGRPYQEAKNAAILAAQLRAQVRYAGALYIESEPNLALAERILSDKTPREETHEGRPREGRNILNGDSRTHTTQTNTSYPNTATGFSEVGCTLAKIGNDTAYFAAHCVFNLSVHQWYCRDSSTAPNENCAQWPRFKFGVEGVTSFSGWTPNACEIDYLSTAFTGLQDPGSDYSAQWLTARWDYVGLDLSHCATGNTGWYGTTVASDVQLGGILYTVGFPARALCPANATGDAGKRSNGQIVPGTTDCPGTGGSAWPGTTWQYASDSNPFLGAQLWVNSLSGSGPGRQQPASTISLTLDTTEGQSGGPIYLKPSADDRRIVGIVSWGGTDVNRANRFNAEVHDYLAAHTPFPEDAQ